MKRILLVLTMLLGLTASHAVWGQSAVRCQRSGLYDMLIRVDGDHNYLMIPIEEAAPEYPVQLIEDGKILRTLTLRLGAKNKIDYYVPLDLRKLDTKSLVLAAHIWTQPQSLHESTPMDYIAWDSLYVADTVAFTNTEKLYRPQYHHAPLWGWMNDPNGMYYDAETGLYHLYYQYNPYCSLWQNLSWGHATSKDLLHWEEQPVAMEPHPLGMIFSGSAVVDEKNVAGFGEKAVLAFYTSADILGQSQSLAYSTDGGITFTHYAGNPILTSATPDFRDPKVFWDTQAGRWTMILACGQEMRFYGSDNLRDWTYLSSFGLGYGNHEGVWECPDLMELPVRGTEESKWVLLCNINPGGPFGGSATQYFVGNWDGTTFQVDDNQGVTTRWMDYGKDHYATVSFAHAPEGRHTVMVWMSNWQYTQAVPTQQFRSANALPRDIDLFVDQEGAYRIGVYASPEVDSLLGKKVASGKKNMRLPKTGIIDVQLTANQSTTIVLSNDKEEQVRLVYNAEENTFSMDRTQSGLTDFHPEFPVVTTTPWFTEGGKSDRKRSIRIYVDRCSIEVFDGAGCWAMTNLVFPTKPYTHLNVQGGRATVYGVNY